MNDLGVGSLCDLCQEMREIAVQESGKCVIILRELVQYANAVYDSIIIALFNYTTYCLCIKSISCKALDEV